MSLASVLEKISNDGEVMLQRQIMNFASNILDGVAMCHVASIIHNDLRPQNILIKDGVAKLADFGSATLRRNSNSANNVKTGPSLCYCAPEILLHFGEQDLVVDVWSFGCILAEMMTGKVLLPGNS